MSKRKRPTHMPARTAAVNGYLWLIELAWEKAQ